MAKTKEEKKEIVKELEDNLDKQKSTYFIDFKGLPAQDLFKMRKKLKEKGGKLYVAKKTLAQIALENKGIEVPPEQISGQLALVFGFEDEIAPAKVVYEFQEENGTPTLLGGMLSGELLSQEKAVEIAKLPSLEELRAKLVGSLQAPIGKLQQTLVNPIKGLMFIFKQKA